MGVLAQYSMMKRQYAMQERQLNPSRNVSRNGNVRELRQTLRTFMLFFVDNILIVA